MSVREILLRNELVNLLLPAGYNVYLPVHDVGIDLIIHREDDQDLKLIQQKSRWTISKKYKNREIWIAFPDGDDWFIAPHDELIKIGEKMGYTLTKSWDEGAYTVRAMSKRLRQECEHFKWKG